MSGISYPNKNSYLVSVIIPIYNVEEYIELSLLSALNQTFKAIEYILIDDRGSDNSMKIVNNVIRVHERKNDIRVIKHEKNKGLSAARNTGMKYATGKYLFFMDSDDEITTDCIEKHYKSIECSGADFTVANIELIGTKSIHTNSLSKSIELQAPFLSFCKKSWSVSAWNKLYNKDFVQKYSLQFIDGLIHEDVLWSFTLSRLAKKIAIVDESTYKYKIRDNSITTKPNSKRKIDCLLYIIDDIRTQFYTDKNIHIYTKEFIKFYDFWRFTTALQLLNYQSKSDDASRYYLKIKSMILSSNNISLYNILLLLPFNIFKSLLSPLYTLYKRRKLL